MTRRAHVTGVLGLAMLAGCATSTSSKPTGTGPAEKTIVLGITRLDPSNLTMQHSEALAFVNTAVDPLQLEFTSPKDQTGIVCTETPSDSRRAPQGAWATVQKGPEGHLTANVPPGRFRSTCKLAVGNYTYLVRPISLQIQNPDLQSGLQGTITVK